MFTAAAGAGELRGETPEIGSDAATLSGHDQVIVYTTATDDAAALGVQVDTMTRFVVRRLTMASIKAVALSDAKQSEALCLSVNVEVLKIGVIYVYVVEARALQRAVLAISSKTAIVVTWDMAFYGSLGTGGTEPIRLGVERLVDSFAKDWATAHEAVDEPVADPFAEPSGEKK